MTGPLHRLAQFWRHSRARVTPAERRQAAEILGPGLTPLFLQMPVNEQRHGLDVLAAVDWPGASKDGRLARQAALLHDVGKAGAHFSVWDRSLAVFLEAVSASSFAAMLRLRPGYRRRFEIYRDHAARGAALIAAAGAPELAGVVAEHHAPTPKGAAAWALRQADGSN